MAESNAAKVLGVLVRQLNRLSNDEFVKEIAERLGTKGRELATQSISAHQSPTGRAWKKRKLGGLALSGLASKLTLRARGVGFAIDQSTDAAFIQQAGAVRKASFVKRVLGKLARLAGVKKVKIDAPVWRLPRRAILPRRVVPKRWAEPFVEIAADGMKKMFKK